MTPDYNGEALSFCRDKKYRRCIGFGLNRSDYEADVQWIPDLTFVRIRR
jgi:hypothetical protein